MAKKTHAQSTKSCSDCVHEYACRMWTDGRMISDESASRCPNHTTVKESAAYLIGKMDGEKHVILTADVAPMAEWISVEERLPEPNEECLVSARVGDRVVIDLGELVQYCDGRIFGWMTTNDWNEGEGCKITHWMPLPKPPKGDAS